MRTGHDEDIVVGQQLRREQGPESSGLHRTLRSRRGQETDSHSELDQPLHLMQRLSAARTALTQSVTPAKCRELVGLVFTRQDESLLHELRRPAWTAAESWMTKAAVDLLVLPHQRL